MFDLVLPTSLGDRDLTKRGWAKVSRATAAPGTHQLQEKQKQLGLQGQEPRHCPGQQEPEQQHSSIDKNTLPLAALQDSFREICLTAVVSQDPGVLIIVATLWNAGMREAGC